jgi:hypothetical protein
MADVQEHGSQPVPPHLLTAGHPAMRRHGIGVGYRYPHDYEGADVEQQYLPDLLRDRRYYRPSDQGMERQIGDRLQRLAEERELHRGLGGRPKASARDPDTDKRRITSRVMRDREERLKRASTDPKG